MVARLTLVATLMVICACVVPPALAAPAPARTVPQRWIVRLNEPPLAQAAGIAPGSDGKAMQSLDGKSTRGRLQINSLQAQRYATLLEQQQNQAFALIKRALPSAKMQRRYTTLFNGMALTLPNADAVAKLRAMPDVLAVYPDAPIKLTMFDSIPQIGADVLWNSPSIGGQGKAGNGIKIAIIDGGIKIDNPFFNPAGFSYPAGFPKGDIAHTTPKVIVARAYFRPDLPPLPGSETPEPGPEDSGHGTHVAGTAAGVGGTEATIAGLTETISGVAPRAYLMNYKTFYANDSVFSGQSFTTELIAALEDAVKDGADVINNSWGGTADVNPNFDPILAAANAAVDAGVTVVFSNGNEGPNASTTGSPGFGDKVISVGASTTAKTIAANFADVVAPPDVPDALHNRRFAAASFGPQVEDTPFGPSSFVPVSAITKSSLACTPLPANTLSGRIALVERGTCGFSVKVFNAQQGGASAVMVYNSEAGGDEVIGMAAGDRADQVTIPSVFVPRSMGVGMTDLYSQAGESAKVVLDPRARVIDRAPDVLADFSSRGPTFQGSLKPDVVAPGVNILSAGFGPGDGIQPLLGFGIISGTSMAAPHVAGSAALLKQVHPDWTPLDIKSALMSTANSDVWLDNDHTERASVLEQGAGRIDLTRAATPGLLFDHPSLSFGELAPTAGKPTQATIVVTARSAASGRQSYTLKANASNGDFAIDVSPATVTLNAGQSARINVTITLPADAAPGDFEGMLRLDGPQPLHLPIWARALPAERGTKVLLVDNDGSSSLELPDYSGYYGNALSELNIPFTYLDVDALAGKAQTLPPLAELQKHEIVIWFTGDNSVPVAGGTPLPLTETDQNLMLAYLQSGGALIASGQNMADASDINTNPPDDPRYGRSDLYSIYLGARFVQDSVYGEATELTAKGTDAQPWLVNIALNLSAPGKGVVVNDTTGAGNQTSVDEVRLGDSDPRWPDKYTTPLITANSASVGASGAIALNRAAEPTLEQPAVALPFRSTYLGFGLEAVRSDTGTTTRKELLQAILYWTVDRPTVTVAGSTVAGTINRPLTFVANAQSNTPTTFVRYRWDFGDGSPILDTNQATVDHQYAKPGTYTVRVEATDSWGHKAIGVSQP